MLNIVFFWALVFFSLSSAHFLACIGGDNERLRRGGLLTAGLGFTALSFTIISRGIQGGYMPITNLSEALSFLGWAITFVYLLFYLKYRTKVLGSFAIPLASGILILSAFSSKAAAQVPPAWRSWWLGLHTVSGFLSYAAFCIAFITAIMYLVQNRQLKVKNPGRLYRWLPSLKSLEEVNYSAIILGFCLLTFAIFIGFFWARRIPALGWTWGKKETWSVITWMIYTAILYADSKFLKNCIFLHP